MEIFGLIFGIACIFHMFGFDEKRQTEENLEIMRRYMTKQEKKQMEVVFFLYVIIPITCLLFWASDKIVDKINEIERQYRKKKEDGK